MKGFKMPGDLGAMMKQAQKLQQEVQRLQEQAKEFEAESSAGGGMVVAVANGKNQLVSLKIDKAVVNPSDIEMLQDLIIAAANEALKKVQERTASGDEKTNRWIRNTGSMTRPRGTSAKRENARSKRIQFFWPGRSSSAK